MSVELKSRSSSTCAHDLSDDCDGKDPIDTKSLIESLQHMSEDHLFKNKGYTKIKKICDTLQGELYKSIKLDLLGINPDHKLNYVAIKKTSKYLHHERIAIEDGTNFCVSDNIIKEALIMKHLTVDNQPIGNYTVKYIDWFQSDTHYYLVMEYIESETTLKEFLSEAEKHISKGNLSIQEYQKMIKYLLWQLFVTFYWLHNCMHCAHLNVCSENILLQNAAFIGMDEGQKVHINPKMTIKLSGFGVSELFKENQQPDEFIDSNNSDNNMFLCTKQGLSIYNEGYFAPNVFNGDVYHAACADNWSLGMIMFQCITVGKQLYSPLNMHKKHSGYYALHHNRLAQYLSAQDMLKYFDVTSFQLLNSLLTIDEQKRLKGIDILQHKYFKMYFQRYKEQILKKNNLQKQHLINQQQKFNKFPFYCLN